MKIKISKPMTAGKTRIPNGEYFASFKHENTSILLVGGGRDYEVLCTKRPGKKKVRFTEIVFTSMDGSTWTLSAVVPNRGEFFAFLSVEKSGSEKK
jgi:hypothetical protein